MRKYFKRLPIEVDCVIVAALFVMGVILGGIASRGFREEKARAETIELAESRRIKATGPQTPSPVQSAPRP